MLPAVFVLERVVPEDEGEGVVYAMPQCAGHIVAVVCVLSRRRLSARDFPAEDAVLRDGCVLCDGVAGVEQGAAEG